MPLFVCFYLFCDQIRRYGPLPNAVFSKRLPCEIYCPPTGLVDNVLEGLPKCRGFDECSKSRYGYKHPADFRSCVMSGGTSGLKVSTVFFVDFVFSPVDHKSSKISAFSKCSEQGIGS